MAPIVKEVTTQAEFSAVIDCFWDSNYDPYTSFMNILFPISEATEEGYAKAVAESKVRLWSYHEQDHTSHWIYVTDDEDTKGWCTLGVTMTDAGNCEARFIAVSTQVSLNTGSAFWVALQNESHQRHQHYMGPTKPWLSVHRVERFILYFKINDFIVIDIVIRF
ncbi:hypothetical protein BTUL_0076g00460 [Botrytis tulipae]|uniref:Uncharacterized protein n=1 Tax=Botrytis tulipae TaxID=87230 RepID=A0A4Z1EL65_9HELO|nr:hypothetical protein BTUL_0076g00460 [Botrytis tulipae]